MKKISIIILLLAAFGIGCDTQSVVDVENIQVDVVEPEDITKDESQIEGPENIEINETFEGKTIYELLEKYNSENIIIETIKVEEENILKITYNEKIEYKDIYENVMKITYDIKDFKSIDEVSVFVWDELEDEYANVSRGLVYSFEYTRATIDNINWERIDLAKFIKLAEGVLSL